MGSAWEKSQVSCVPPDGAVSIPNGPASWLLAAGRDPEHCNTSWDDVLARDVAAAAAPECLLVEGLPIRLGDEEDDLPLAVEPQAHRGARSLGEPATHDLDAPVLVPAGSELAADERAGLLLP
jgi:hypothetical protein